MLDEGIIARFSVVGVATAMDPDERLLYLHHTERIKRAMRTLLSTFAFPATPIATFMREVGGAAADPAHPAHRVALTFQRHVTACKQLLAAVRAKGALVEQLVPALGPGARTLIFSESIGSVEHLACRLRAAGVAAAALHSDIPRSRRTELLRLFGTGQLTTLATPRALDEGVDVPAADVAIIVAASRTRRQMVQRMGRVLRKKPDGGAACFVVVYAEGTTEDLRTGAHEAFLAEMTENADQISILPAGTPLGEVEAVVRNARHGGPCRSGRTGAVDLVGDVSAAEFFGTADEPGAAGSRLASPPPPGVIVSNGGASRQHAHATVDYQERFDRLVTLHRRAHPLLTNGEICGLVSDV